MVIEIRCPKCGKLVAKKEQEANCEKIYFYCSRCKQNFEIKSQNK